VKGKSGLFKVYLAGPIRGRSYDVAVSWRNYVSAQLLPDIIAYSPMRAKEMLRNALVIDGKHQIQHPLTVPRGIMTRDRFDVATSDLLFVNFLQASAVSIGTVMEIAWADYLRKPIVLVMEEDNIHNHAMVREAAGFIVSTLEEGIEITKAILLPS